MIKEDYVSFEVAKLLKEKGFDDVDCECHGWIGRSGKHYSADDTFYDDKELKEAQEDRKDFIPLITHQMAMAWLREVYNISIRPRYEEVEDEKELLHYLWFFDILSMNPYKMLVEPKKGYNTYEEAVEAALKYSLENLV